MPEVNYVDKGSLLTSEEACGLHPLIPVLTLAQVQAWRDVIPKSVSGSEQ